MLLLYAHCREYVGLIHCTLQTTFTYLIKRGLGREVLKHHFRPFFPLLWRSQFSPSPLLALSFFDGHEIHVLSIQRSAWNHNLQRKCIDESRILLTI